MNARITSSLLAGIAALTIAGVARQRVAAAPLGTAFTYQGQLQQGGGPASGGCDFQFDLFAAAAGGSSLGTQAKSSVGVTDGLFTVELDFGAAFAGDDRYLEIQVRCPAGGGSYTVLSPRQKLTAAPYALYAPAAGSAPWAGLTGVPAGFSDSTDNDTTYSAGSGLTLSGNQFSVNTTVVQARVSGTCAAGSAVRAIDAAGAVTCEADDNSGGTVTSITAGTGLTGGTITTSGMIAANFGSTADTVAAGNHDHFGQSWSGGAYQGLAVQTTFVDGIGIDGTANNGTIAAGVHGVSANGRGVAGHSTTGVGVFGSSPSGVGVRGLSGSGTSGITITTASVLGDSNQTVGVAGTSSADDGVYGVSSLSDGNGVHGVANTGSDARGVMGGSETGIGVFGDSTSGFGVYGLSGSGASGITITTAGVRGDSNMTVGVAGTSSADDGVYGESSLSGGRGVHGVANTGSNARAVFGESTDGTGVYAYSNSGVPLVARGNSGNLIEAYKTVLLGNNRRFYVDNAGNVYADGNFNGGGADVAERIDAHEPLQPGDLVEVDPDHPDHFRLSRSAYSTLVAGVVSTSPGVTLNNNDLDGNDSGVRTDDRPLLALVGKAPVKVTTENGPLRPGDLLVASATPGHAMKAGANVPPGTIIGKALEPLVSGTGAVKMLVMLR